MVICLGLAFALVRLPGPSGVYVKMGSSNRGGAAAYPPPSENRSSERYRVDCVAIGQWERRPRLVNGNAA